MTLGTFLVAWVPGRGGDGLSSGRSGEQSEVEDQPITHHHHHHHKGEQKIQGKREAETIVVPIQFILIFMISKCCSLYTQYTFPFTPSMHDTDDFE